jgi:acyl carrier protein
MFEATIRNGYTKQEIESGVIDILQEMVDDWDSDFTDPIFSQTRLVEDLDFESIDLIQLIVAIEKKFNVKGLPYEKILMKDSAYIDEIFVYQLSDFLFNNLNVLKRPRS